MSNTLVESSAESAFLDLHKKLPQQENPALAKLQQKYSGRKTGSRANREHQLKKYADVVDLIQQSDLSLRKIARITSRSINTVIKVRDLIAA